MKKLSYILCILVVLLSLTACIQTNSVNKFLVLQESINGLEYTEETKVYYYDNINTLKDLDNTVLDKYDDDYFKNDSLVIITLKDNNKNEYHFLSMSNGPIVIDRYLNKTGELIEWTFILEIKNKVPNGENLVVEFKNTLEEISHLHTFTETVIEPTCQKQGYTHYECYCRYNYNDNYTDLVDCQIENGECIWCGEKNSNIDYNAFIFQYTKNYFNDYYTKIISTYKEFYSILKDEYKEMKSIKNTFNEEFFIDNSLVVISDKYDDHVYNFTITELVKENGKLMIDFYMLEDPGTTNVVFSMMFGVKKSDIDNIEDVEYSINKYEYSYIVYPDIISGCEIYNEYQIVINNRNYDLNNYLDIYNVEGFIDLDTLKVYKDKINVNKETHLERYNNKVEDHILSIYLFKNNDFEFWGHSYLGHNLTDYELVIDDKGNFVIEENGLTYVFENDGTAHDESKHYPLISLSGSYNLFNNDYQEVIRKLNILFGSSNYFNNTLSIEVEDGSFKINFYYDNN